MVIKSFRGKMADDSVDTITLHTNNGSTGYRLTKFQVMPVNSDTNVETTMAIYKIPQTAASTDVDFSDNSLLAAAIYTTSSSNLYNPEPIIIFDNEIFNQDIFITIKGSAAAQAAMNYYIELEQIKLDLNENTVATLKDIRNIDQQFDTTIN